MNILPMVFIFITILSLLSIQSIKNSSSIKKQTDLAFGYMEAERNFRKKSALATLKKVKEKKEIKRGQIEKKHLRKKLGSKINLALLSHLQIQKELKKFIESIIKQTYGHFKSFEIFDDPEKLTQFTEDFSQAIVKKIKEDEGKEISLTGINMESLEHRALLHKMLVGTTQRKQTFTGYPSLMNLFIIKNTKGTKLLNFNHLSYEQIELFFGSKIKERIFEDEKKEQKLIDKTKLQSYLGNDRLFLTQNLIDQFSFSNHNFTNQTIKGIDQKTQISIQWD